MIKTLKNKTGLEFNSKDLRFCVCTDIKKYNCKPQSHGWVKAKDVNGIKVSDTFLRQISLQYILQNDNAHLNCHNIDIYNSFLNSFKGHDTIGQNPDFDFLFDKFNSIKFSEAFQAKAIEEAIYTLKAEAAVKQYKLTPEMLASFKNNLKREINNRSNTSMVLNYVIVEITGFGDNDAGLKINKENLVKYGFNDCLEKYENGFNLVLGIAGFAISKFQANQDIFEEDWMIRAIEASIIAKGSEDIKILSDLKTSASVNW